MLAPEPRISVIGAGADGRPVSRVDRHRKPVRKVEAGGEETLKGGFRSVSGAARLGAAGQSRRIGRDYARGRRPTVLEVGELADTLATDEMKTIKSMVNAMG